MAIKCPKCQAENPETKQLCADCGTQLSLSKGIEVSVTRTLETTSDELARGSLFAGRYEIIEELGTGGMGRSDDINSGDSEIYICLAPRPHLDGKYTVFGQLIEGYDTLEKISNVAVEEKWEGPDKKLAVHKPIKPVVIERAWLKERDG